MPLQLFVSNKVEKLSGFLAEGLKANSAEFRAADPLRKTRIAVQSKGVEIWLKQYFVDSGIAVINYEFPFMQNAVKDILKINFGDSIVEKTFRIYSEKTMIWSIDKILQEEQDCGFPAFAGDDASADIKRFQLAICIASEFDRLLTYRPEILTDWEAGGSRNVNPSLQWLPELWRKLRKANSDCSDTTATLISRFMQLDKAASADPLSVFGIGSMPECYFELLRKHATENSVNFFYTDICMEYWKYHPLKWEKLSAAEKEISMQKGEYNPVIRANGHRNREFFGIVERSIPEDENSEEWHTDWVENETGDLLAELQNEILYMTSAEAGEKRSWDAENDHSLLLHGASSAMRQVEIAHDIILDALAKGDITLNDILVMAPDIGVFANHIHAVFSQDILKDRYVVTDRNIDEENSLVNCMKSIFEAARGRFELSNIIRLLRCRIIMQEFGLDSAAVASLEKILSSAGIRWGADAKMHEEVCGTAFPEYSWQSGFDRIFAGLAFADTDLPMAPVCGCDDSGTRNILAAMLKFFRMLEDLRKQLSGKNTINDWCSIVKKAVNDFTGAKADIAERSVFLQSLSSVAIDAACGGCGGIRYPFDIFHAALQKAVTAPPASTSFLSGRITFSSIMPMRNIPFKVIILLGMDDGKFPRRDPIHNIDVFGVRKEGERSRVFEDRAVFLETLLAAKKQLAILFCCRPPSGRGEDVPPAAPVNELFDYIVSTRENGKSVYIKHPANAFDIENFTDKSPGVFSYSQKNFDLSQVQCREKENFFDMETDCSGTDFQPETFSVKEIQNFLLKPQEYFLEKNMGMNTWIEYNSPDDAEIFDLQKNKLALSIVQKEMGRFVNNDHDDSNICMERIFNMSLLPVGRAGEQVINDIKDNMKLTDDLAEKWNSQERTIVDITLPNKDKIIGTVEALPDRSGAVSIIFKEIKEKDIIKFYITHLLLAAMSENEIPVKSIMRGASNNELKILENISHSEAVTILENIISAAKKARIRCPRIFPGASVKFVQTNIAPDTLRRTAPSKGELDNWAAVKCFPADWDINDFRKDFIDETMAVYTALANNLKAVKK